MKVLGRILLVLGIIAIVAGVFGMSKLGELNSDPLIQIIGGGSQLSAPDLRKIINEGSRAASSMGIGLGDIGDLLGGGNGISAEAAGDILSILAAVYSDYLLIGGIVAALIGIVLIVAGKKKRRGYR